MAIVAGSLAVDTGVADGAAATDQRGFARAGAVDIGAYELQSDLIFSNAFEAPAG